MRGHFLIFCLSLFFASSVMAAPYRAALVADMDTGTILYHENAYELNYPASLTKIMTLYLTFDALQHGRLHLDDYLIVSNVAANAAPVKLGLSAGSKISVEDAIKAVAVVSANDVAQVLAENLKGGKEGNFADLMTRVATQIGLKNTNFENSSGLPNDDHMSTARDIALLAIAVYRHFPQYWKYFGIKTWTYNGKTYTNGNRLLGTYPGCDGMKTGFTNKSKYSLVATANRNGHRLMSVVLGADNKDVRATVSTNMLNKGFAMVGNVPVATPSVSQTVSQTTAQTQSVPKTINQSYQVATSTAQQHAIGNAGGAGVQFGAFSSRDAAQEQVVHIKNALGVSAVIEVAPNGMYRVRVNNMSETAAQNLKISASAQGIDSYIFH